MDWRNEESDHSSVENFIWDEKNHLPRTKSDISLAGAIGCNICSQGVQATFGRCEESRSFSSVLERLELEAEIDSKDDTLPRRRTSDAQTDPLDTFKTRDSWSCRSIIHNTDILYYQGTRHSPEEIARYWKKDSRMWLWKSVRLMRRRSRCEPSDNECRTNHGEESSP